MPSVSMMATPGRSGRLSETSAMRPFSMTTYPCWSTTSGVTTVPPSTKGAPGVHLSAGNEGAEAVTCSTPRAITRAGTRCFMTSSSRRHVDAQLAPAAEQVEARCGGQRDLPRAVRVHHEQLEPSPHRPVEQDLLTIGGERRRGVQD